MSEDARSRWAWREDPRTAVRTTVLWETLDSYVAQRGSAVGRAQLHILDLGGGTGGFAVPLAQLGHQVTVLDPSPDALAALQRRAAEAEVAHLITATQADTLNLAEVFEPGSADMVLCHGVLEYVDDPAAATSAALSALAHGGFASFLVAQRMGAVLARALAGQFAAARDLLASESGAAATGDRLLRRFYIGEVHRLIEQAGATVQASYGVRWITDLLPGALVDGETANIEDLLDVERRASVDGALSALAAHAHVVAQR